MSRFFSSVKGILVLPLILSFSLLNLSTKLAYAASETVSSVDSYNVSAGQANAVNGIQINGTGNDNISVRLFVPAGTLELTTTTGLTLYTSNPNNELRFSGLRNDVNAALASLQFTPDGINDATLNVTIIENGYIYNPDNQHVYKIVSSMGDWNAAQAGAATESFQSIPGYLATVTSQNESNYITEQLDQDGWIGASDDTTVTGDVEGEWYWATGPEANTKFWSGDYTGSAVSGEYTNWDSSSEPNDSGGGEDCAQILAGGDGLWNDMPCNFLLPNYIVEFGTPGNLPVVEYKNIALNVEPQTVNVATCDELFALDDAATGDVYLSINLTADIDCGGRTEPPLFNNYTFAGSIAGNGHTIKNLNINETDDNPAGLFGRTSDFRATKLTLDNVNVNSTEDAGALVGYIDDGVAFIEDVIVVNSSVTSDDRYVGGLVGDFHTEGAEQTVVRRSSFSGTVTATDGNIGGLIGHISADTSPILIEQVYADAEITVTGSGEYIGGLIGRISTDGTTFTLQDAYSWSNISAPESEEVGGLVGRLDAEAFPITITRTYASGTVEGYDVVGGLIGFMTEPNTEDPYYLISDSFSMSPITVNIDSNPRSGGLFADMASVSYLESTNNYVDATRTGQTECSNQVTIPNCAPVNINNSDPNYFINNNTNQPMAN
jgi:hypothetical protein